MTKSNKTQSHPLVTQHPLMVFDVESIGLYGDGVAFSAIVVDPKKKWKELQEFSCYAQPHLGKGVLQDHRWVEKNVSLPEDALEVETLREVRDNFWHFFQTWKQKGALLLADCLYPVESNFVAACVADEAPSRNWEGPYPFYDLESLRLLVHLPSLPRLPSHQPEHNPLCDVRHSIRTLRAIIDLYESR